jgi:5-methylcytosine-specific restriction endonuclease McrA
MGQPLLSSNVLVLNKVFQAIQIISVRKAFALLYKGQVKAVLEDYSTYGFQDWKDIPILPDDEYVTTPTFRIKVPRVILLLQFDKLPKQEVKFCRKNIFLRDNNRCQYCGKKYSTEELNLDHVVPTSKGGKTCWENVVCSCLTCNVKKGSRIPEEASIRLISKPVKPNWHPLLKLALSAKFHKSWKNFIDVAYWNVEIQAGENG